MFFCAVPLLSLQGGAGAILGAARTLAQLQPAGVQVGTGSCGDRARSSRPAPANPVLHSAVPLSALSMPAVTCSNPPLPHPTLPRPAPHTTPHHTTPATHHTSSASPVLHFTVPISASSMPAVTRSTPSRPHPTPLHPCTRFTSSQPRVRTWSAAAPPSPATSTQQHQARRWRSMTQTQRDASHWQMHCGTHRRRRARRYVGVSLGARPHRLTGWLTVQAGWPAGGALAPLLRGDCCSCSLTTTPTQCPEHNIPLCAVALCLLLPVLQYVVDIATLTGAAGVALGQDTAALFANTDSLAAAVDGAGKKTGGTADQAPVLRTRTNACP